MRLYTGVQSVVSARVLGVLRAAQGAPLRVSKVLLPFVAKRVEW